MVKDSNREAKSETIQFRLSTFDYTVIKQYENIWMLERSYNGKIWSIDVIIPKKINNAKYATSVSEFGKLEGYMLRYPKPSEFGQYGWNFYPTDKGRILADNKYNELCNDM